MRLLLDTVTFLWAVDSPGRITRRAMSAMRSGAAVREMSVVSLSEIAIKLSIGKLAFGKEEVMQESPICSYAYSHTPRITPSAYSICRCITRTLSIVKSSLKRWPRISP